MTKTIRTIGVLALTTLLGFWPSRGHATCIGDCDANGAVTVDELIIMVNIALDAQDIDHCTLGDANGDGRITVDEIVAGVQASLAGCTSAGEPTSMADAAARDADGVALHLGQTVTTEGVVTVAAGLLANKKLKIFIQDGPAGIMVYDQSSDQVDAFQPGQRLRVTGMVIQKDPTSDNNPANGTVAVDISNGTWSVQPGNYPVPDPQAVTLATLNANGTVYTGSLVRITGARKVAGSWPPAGSQSTQVIISDDGGTTTLQLRFQRFTNTTALATKLAGIGDGPFTLVGIVVQDDETPDGTLLSGFEIWERGAADITPE
jgi:hypothetical protein